MTPSKQNRERAREILNRYYDFPTQRLEYKSCLDELTTVLSAKDGEIERVRETLRNQNWDWTAFQDQPTLTEQVDVVLKTIHDLSADGLTWRQRAATARADAIKECANLARAMAAGETYETGRQKAINIVAALESLLNEKEHGNNG
jgi:hypothetical protein